MQIDQVITGEAPAAIGPYSQAIKCSGLYTNLIFVSGQLPIDPLTNELIEGDIALLTCRVLDNIEAILKASDSDLSKVIKVEIFLKNLNRDFSGMNMEYAKRFSETTPPARQTIQVSDLPKGAAIEISCIATHRTPETMSECSDKIRTSFTKENFSKTWSEIVEDVRRFFSK